MVLFKYGPWLTARATFPGPRNALDLFLRHAGGYFGRIFQVHRKRCDHKENHNPNSIRLSGTRRRTLQEGQVRLIGMGGPPFG